MRTFLAVCVAGLTCWLVGARTASQETHEASWMPVASTTQHAMLMKRVGTWDADVSFLMGPQPMKSKATMTYEPMGKFWVVGRYEGEFMGEPMHGIEIAGYDPVSKEFISLWVDSMTPTPTESRGTWDDDSATMTLTSLQTMPNMATGEDEKSIYTSQVEGDDRLRFSMRMESSEEPLMEIIYTRRK